jgi:hypothetical protein
MVVIVLLQPRDALHDPGRDLLALIDDDDLVEVDDLLPVRDRVISFNRLGTAFLTHNSRGSGATLLTLFLDLLSH